MPDAKEITIAEVAQEAGVSVSTISRILNDKPDVAEKTRQRVQQVIEDLGYTPHVQAQRLAAGKSRTIALLYPIDYIELTRQEMGFISGVGKAFGQANFFFNLVTSPVTEVGLRNLYRSAQVDGVILMEVDMDDWRVEFLREHNYPFVMIGRSANNTGLDFIDLDHENAIVTAYDHLIALGHQHIGFMAYPLALRQRGFGAAVRTMRGYERACKKHNLKSPLLEVELSTQELYESTLQFLDNYPHLTAIMTAEGSTTVGVIRALQKLKRSIPDDFSVITVTTKHTAQLISPTLTSIDFPSHTMGYKAAQMLISLLKGEPLEINQILLPPQLHIRESTGPCLDGVVLDDSSPQ